MSILERIFWITFIISSFYLLKINIVLDSLINAGELVTHIKIYAISASQHGKLTDEDLNYILGKLEIESVVKNSWFCFLCPWIWSTKQCFKKSRFKKIMAFYKDIQF